jgi:hypothetical protein
MAKMKWDLIIQGWRAEGLTVVELAGWRSRGRSGAHDPDGVVCHHTGGTADSRAYIDWMALEGRPSEGIPAPLAQIGLARTGTVYMMAAGRANQAGKCRRIGNWLRAGDGNAQTVGIEAMHSGKEPWTAKHYRAYVIVVGVICRVMGWSVDRAVGHKEISLSGKWDPTFDMSKFRRDVAAWLATNGETLPDTGADVMTPDQEDRIIEAIGQVGQGVVNNRDVIVDNTLVRVGRLLDDLKVSLGQVGQTIVNSRDTIPASVNVLVGRQLMPMAAQLGSLAAAVDALSTGAGVSPEAIRNACQDGAEAALSKLVLVAKDED